ncbi:helix-turn-helix transcriptional regulator [Leucobacter sp. L43]|uniref:helix-turn-helix transcriptional regulator n=1 Tax=Leucobacter sp. L43 TaxID=2798040 RepID=UPI001907BC41|nr:helix-turn-helix transcriptional regulator [Leucobacter sp. L43]
MSRAPGEARGFGKTVQTARLGHGWSQGDLAKQAGVSRPTVSRIELGQEPSVKTLRRIADALGLVVEVKPEGGTPPRP